MWTLIHFLYVPVEFHPDSSGILLELLEFYPDSTGILLEFFYFHIVNEENGQRRVT